MTAAAPSDPEAQFDSRQPRTLTAPSYPTPERRWPTTRSPRTSPSRRPHPRHRASVENRQAAPRETAETRRRETARNLRNGCGRAAPSPRRNDTRKRHGTRALRDTPTNRRPRRAGPGPGSGRRRGGPEGQRRRPERHARPEFTDPSVFRYDGRARAPRRHVGARERTTPEPGRVARDVPDQEQPPGLHEPPGLIV